MFIWLLSVCAVESFCESLAFNSKGPIECVYLKNHLCKARPTFININSDETLFYPSSVCVNKCGGSSNTIDDPYAQLCVPNKVKNMNLIGILVL